MIQESFRKLQKVKTKESNEPLLDIKKHCPKNFIKIWGVRKNEKSFYARKTIIKKLKLVKIYLPKGYYLRVEDAYRPSKIQKHYYKKEYRRLKRKYPKWSERKIKELQNTLVYPPELDTPPHMTGGSLDVTLTCDLQTGKSIPMETKLMPKYKQNPIFAKDLPKHIKKNRLLLYKAMDKAGFYNYSKEWWHWSYGDKKWALGKNKKYAVYGAVPEKLLPEVFKPR